MKEKGYEKKLLKGVLRWYIERAVPLSRVKVDEASQVVDAHSSFFEGWGGRRCSDSERRGRERNGVWIN